MKASEGPKKTLKVIMTSSELEPRAQQKKKFTAAVNALLVLDEDDMIRAVIEAMEIVKDRRKDALRDIDHDEPCPF